VDWFCGPGVKFRGFCWLLGGFPGKAVALGLGFCRFRPLIEFTRENGKISLQWFPLFSELIPSF
jgi:hypothetical protein